MPTTAVDVSRKTYVPPARENQRPGVLSAEETGPPSTGKKAESDLPPPGGGKPKKVSREQTHAMPEEPNEG